MNGYEKMKRLRRVKVTKAISAVTALSMTVTGLAVAASANSADPDYISRTLGGLTEYGIVAGDMTTSSHFEANFAVNNLTLNDFFDVSAFINDKSRTVTFNVTSNETFEDGMPKTHYLGIYRNNGGVGELIDVEYSLGDGEESEKTQYIAVKFTSAGTQSFNIRIPDEYKYETLTVHKLKFVADEDELTGEFVIEDAGTILPPFAQSAEESYLDNARNIIGENLATGSEKFGTNKRVYVGPEIYKYIRVENDGRIFYDHNPVYEWRNEGGYNGAFPVLDENGNQVYDTHSSAPIANNTNEFILMENAPYVVNGLLDTMQTASAELSEINSASNLNNVLYLEINGSVHSRGKECQQINKCFAFLKEHPDYYMLVNVKLEKGENTYNFNYNPDPNDRSDDEMMALNGRISDRDLDTASRIVFNFIGGDVDDTLVILGDSFAGTALAPNARVRVAATFPGAIYSPQVAVASGEIHMATYRSFEQAYWAEYEDIEILTETSSETTTPVETTTPEETTTTPPAETTTPEETTTTPPVETTTPEETTTTPPVETTTPEETTTTPPVETTTPEETTTTPPVETTTPEETTTTPPVETTTPEETTTTPPVETTTPEETTTTPPVETTTPEETTTTPPVETTTPEETTTTPPAETTTPEETTTTPPVETTEPEETTPETTEPPEIITSTAPETTTTVPGFHAPETTTTTTAPETEAITTPEETTVTTVDVFSEEATTTTSAPNFFVPETTTTTVPPAETTTEAELPPVTTTLVTTTELPPVTTEATVTVPVTIRIEEDVPRGAVTPDVPIIMIDERVPLGDRPMNTGVESKVGLFAAIGGAALLIGVGAQVYSVILKKKR